ncbi:MAG: hypothetical protein AB7E79_17180 [Rhodospirillaceae bacterium]
MADVMNKSFPTLQKAFARLKTEVHARYGKDLVLTDRLKMLISAGAGLLIFAMLIALHQTVSSLEREYDRVQIDKARLEAQIAAGGWEERKQQSQVLKSLLEERLWAAQTPGLADASFERWLRDRLTPHKLEPIAQIQVRRVPIVRAAQPGEPENPLSTIQRMTAKLILPFDGAGVSHFLADVAEADKAVVVDRMIVRAGRNARIEVDVSTFYRSAERS